MNRISLIYGYSARNAGDFAITLGAIDVLLELGVKINLFSRYNEDSNDYKTSLSTLKAIYADKLQIYGAPFSLNRADGIIKTIYTYYDGVLTLLNIKKKDSFRRLLLDADYIIFNGGNLFRCKSFIDYTRLRALMYPLILSKKANIPFVIFPQSASHLNCLGKKTLLPIIKGAERVILREQLSFNYLSGLINSDKFLQSIDLAFFINKSHLPAAPIDVRGKIVMTLRYYTVGDIKYLPSDRIEMINQNIDYFIKNKSKDKEVVLIVQTDKDLEHSQLIAKKYNLQLYKTNDVHTLLSIYKSADLLVGMRLHSIILALSVGTPCYGLFYKEWGLKNPGLMSYFKMPYTLFDDKSICMGEIEQINKLIVDRQIISKNILSIVDSEKKKLIESLSFLKN